MSRIIDALDARLYDAMPDARERLRESVLRHVRPESVVLNFGAGRGARTPVLQSGECAHLAAVDVGEAVLSNPYVDEAALIAPDGQIPHPDATFDIVFSVYVLEHLEDPVGSFREIARVLKPGGVAVHLTPNKYHYVPLVAALTPHSFHEWVNAKRGGIDEADVFPTFYRVNTRADLGRVATASGMELERVELSEDRPNYLAMSGPTFALGALYERVVNGFDALRGLRVTLVSTLRKP